MPAHHNLEAYLGASISRRRRSTTPARLPCSVPLSAGALTEKPMHRVDAQAMAAHESPRTTKLYDRTGDEITLDEVERISI